MTSRLNPYLNFDGSARDAMEFYRDIFGGELTVNTYAEFGAPEGVDPDAVMHAMLETPSGFTLMAADTPPGMPVQPGSSMVISLTCDDPAEGDDLRGYWERLSDGGEVQVPLERQMWGDDFGQCTDRFGIAWMVDIAPDTAE